MKLAIILSTNNTETNWNALRLANIALSKGDIVTIFLLGEGVEYEKNSSSQFNITEQIEKFLHSENSKIIACETCMNFRKQKGNKTCPVGGMIDLYNLVINYDKVLTF